MPPPKSKTREGDVDVINPGVQARLFDFDIEGSRLAPVHQAFLEELIATIKSRPGENLTIAISGHTDTLGVSRGFDNKKLSEQRAAAVADFLRVRLPPGANVRIDMNGFGPLKASEKNAPDVDDAFFRAVDVALTKPGEPPPERPKRPHLKIPKPAIPPLEKPRPEFSLTCLREAEIERSQDFEVRIQSGTFGGIGLQVARFIFQIKDTNRKLQAEYAFNGVDAIVIGGDAGLIRDGSTTFKPFRTDFPTKVTEFDHSTTIITGPALVRTDKSNKPTIKLTYLTEAGQTQSVTAEIDMGSLNTPHRFVGDSSLNTTCGRKDLGNQTRGADKI
jgi:hypothetical protein